MRIRVGLLCTCLALWMAVPGGARAETLTADADADVILNGDNDNDFDPTLANLFGNSVASAGDFNGDGVDDVIVGDRQDSHSTSFGGSAYIFFGGQTGTISDPDGHADVVLRGHGTFAESVASAGDFNGDGYDDVIVGWAFDSTNGPQSGSAFVFFGQDYATQQVLDAHVDADVVIYGRDHSQLGHSVASAGDFDGDGLDDVIVGGVAHVHDGLTGTSVYIVFGRDDPSQQILIAETDAELALLAQTSTYGFGDAVASAGDFDGDGLDDVIVGAFGGNGFFGSAYIFFGGRTGTIDDPEANADVVLYGEGGHLGFGQFGHSVASVGDYNGDGFDDVVVGNDFYNFGVEIEAGLGAAFVFFGGQTGPLVESGADLTVTAPGVGLPGTAGLTDFLGFSVASAGDFNGDGLADVIIGSPGTSGEDSILTTGSAYIYFGPRTGVFDDPDASADMVLRGQDLHDFFGFSVAAAGDFDGDGLDDVIVGAPSDNNVAEFASGAAFLFFGRESASESEPPVASDIVATPNPLTIDTHQDDESSDDESSDDEDWDDDDEDSDDESGDEETGGVSILTAIASTGTAGSFIESASYTIDGGASMPMSAADRSFDEPVEDLTAILVFDLTGEYEICVTATDAEGGTSEPACILLTVYRW